MIRSVSGFRIALALKVNLKTSVCVCRKRLTSSNSIVELVKHRVHLIAGGIVFPHEWTVVRDDHRDIGELPLAKLHVTITRSSVRWLRSRGGR
jgi:hypothetical protein